MKKSLDGFVSAELKQGPVLKIWVCTSAKNKENTNMKKQINPTIKAHLIRGAFYLLLLLAVCAIPFALAERRGTKQSIGKPAAANAAQFSSAKAMLARLSDLGLPGPKARANALPGHRLGVVKGTSVTGNTPLGCSYQIDDGTAEDSIGLTNGGTFAALNEFPVTGGCNLITAIQIAWGTPVNPDPTLDGLAYTAVLWSDPNGDGSPHDAVVLASAPGVISQEGTNTFITTTIPPTLVTTPNFFVGFLITHNAGQFPAAYDESNPLSNRSWVDQTTDINDLSQAILVETTGLPPGNWLIRAVAQPVGTPSLTPTASPTPTCQINYTTTTSTDVITPGGTDIGNHCDDCFTQIDLPFPVNVYGVPTSTAWPASNGDLHFANPTLKSFYYQQCVPVDPSPDGPWPNTLFPFYDDMLTMDGPFQTCADCGIFTQTVGSPPNRQFIIRWKTVYFNNAGNAEFEVILTEGSDTFSVIYGDTSGDNGLTGASGIQQDLSVFTSFSCFEATLTSGLRVDYIPTGCASPTPTATATATATPTATAAPRSTPTPRPRPTPVPRP